MDIYKQRVADEQAQNELRQKEQPFIILGFSDDNDSQYRDIYIYVSESRRTMVLKPNQLKGTHLKWVAPHAYWLKFYGTDDRRMTSGVNWRQVKQQILRDVALVGEYQGQFYSVGNPLSILVPRKIIKTNTLSNRDFQYVC